MRPELVDVVTAAGVCSKLEADVKRLKSDLQSSRCLEQELRSQIASLSFSDRTTKSELYQLRQENESLQSKYAQRLVSDIAIFVLKRDVKLQLTN